MHDAKHDAMHDAITTIVLGGGTVKFSHKSRYEDEIEEVNIFRSRLRGEPIICVVTGPGGLARFDNLDEAVTVFMQGVFTKRNLALALRGARRHGLAAGDLDDLSVAELKALVKKYNDEYFAKDYPFAT